MTARFLLAATLALAAAHADATIEAFGELLAATQDQFGDTLGGIGSGVVYDAKNDLFLCLTDRGPDDGGLPYRPRYVKLRIAQNGKTLTPTLMESVLFRDENGREMTGLIPDDPTAPTPRMKDGRTCIDPEALALAPDGSLYVTDEYGPSVYQFHPDGTMIRRIPLPAEYTPLTASGKTDFTDAAPLTSGRNINQGPEGMSILPDGTALVLAFQSGLVQDGGHRSPTTRILVIDTGTGEPLATYVYPFAPETPTTHERLRITSLSVNDIIALSPTKFLVLERDKFGRTGSSTPAAPKLKAVWLADATHATNLSTSPTTPPVPVTKSLVVNLPDIVPDPATLAAKWEGIALLPGSNDRDVILLMTADNDFLTPVIRHDGVDHPFPRAEDSVPTQFYKIRATLP